MILPIYIYGNAVLRKVSEDITPDYPDLEVFISNMFETLKASDGIGLAAPQVGKAVRVVVIDLRDLAETFPEYATFCRAYINPHILEYDETERDSSEEGCLSLPGIHESVKRPKRIRVSYCDADFTQHEEWVEGYLARVMQHEFDHLDGKVFIDRISPMRRSMISAKLKALLAGCYRCDYKTKAAPRK